VVISIISLLSTVVLASLDDAREKATNSKIVQEAVQLRNAIELYRSDYGEVPFECKDYTSAANGSCTTGGGIYKTGIQDNWLDYYWGGSSYSNSSISDLETLLVDNGYLASLPEEYKFCADDSCNYEIGYITAPYDDISVACGGCDDYLAYCGGEPYDDYLIYILEWWGIKSTRI